MKMLLSTLGLLSCLVAFTASAESIYLDSEPMRACGGSIQLREAGNGDLSIKLNGDQSLACNTLKFVDVSSGRTIKSYEIKGSSYTLSKSQSESLSDDCKLGIKIGSSYGPVYEQFEIVLGWCSSRHSQPSYSNSGFSFQKSHAGNCKLMVNGQYQNKNVSDAYCQYAEGSETVSYEYSNKGNCKVMIDGKYDNQNVSEAFCQARF